MKILIIDCLFVPSLKGKIAGGVQIFTRNQMELLDSLGETYYITAAGSNKIYENQFILNNIFSSINSTRQEKIKVTKAVNEEILSIIRKINPDLVLDSSCKHITSVWPSYKNGIVFEHYHCPSFPLAKEIKNRFTNSGIHWIGVSKWQKQRFNNLFDDTINIHYIKDRPKEIKQSEEYGVFIGRWDPNKSPHIIFNNYLKSGIKHPIECFIKGNLEEKNLKILMKNPQLKFHIDAPREQIFNVVSKAMFGLGMGKESTGISCLEYVTHGVPYIVSGSKITAEQEHLPANSIYFCDRSLEKTIPEQIYDAVTDIETWNLENRIAISEYVCNKYNKEHFVNEHKRVITPYLNRGMYGLSDCSSFL